VPGGPNGQLYSAAAGLVQFYSACGAERRDNVDGEQDVTGDGLLVVSIGWHLRRAPCGRARRRLPDPATTATPPDFFCLVSRLCRSVDRACVSGVPLARQPIITCLCVRNWRESCSHEL
jgi:hypothetical protein